MTSGRVHCYVCNRHVGTTTIARNVALVTLAQRNGFNAKLEQLRAYLHMNWQITVLQSQTATGAHGVCAARTTYA